MENNYSFYGMMKSLTKFDTPIGDLARDICEDASFPKESTDKKELIAYLESRGAANAVIEVFNAAWDKYKNSH